MEVCELTLEQVRDRVDRCAVEYRHAETRHAQGWWDALQSALRMLEETAVLEASQGPLSREAVAAMEAG